MNVSSRAMLPVVVWMGIAAVPAAADSIYGTPRQYYSDYTYVPSYGYGYRTYYFKPTPYYAGYDYHYVIYPASDPHHAYYYNPHTQQFWGRCPSHCHGEPLYSFLPPNLRKGTLGEIPPTAFPKPGPLPNIPGADDTKLDLAPDNTPIVGAPAPAAAGAPPGTPPVVGAGAPPIGAGPPPVGEGAPPIGAGPPPGVPTADAPPPDAPPAAAAVTAAAAPPPGA